MKRFGARRRSQDDWLVVAAALCRRPGAVMVLGLILSAVGISEKAQAIDFSLKKYEATSSNGPVEMPSFECRGRKYVYETPRKYALSATTAGIELSRADDGRVIRVKNYPAEKAVSGASAEVTKADAAFRAQLPKDATDVKVVEMIEKPCSAGDWDGFGLTYSYQLNGALCHRIVYVIRILPEEAMVAQFDETKGKFAEAKDDFIDFICRLMVFEDELLK